ncbi:hypothetical protein BHV42_08425 [Candidatus Melainabacteria bacterium MEL.A1]|nr:hypothetical protein BHV42_08425 [Candidatus Melainabacteria bacterium MEL.A1]
MLKNKHKFNAFTLAEMMVVMLIMSIILAAMAPVMTTKNKVDNSSPWKYSPNNSSDAYFGQGASMRAMIGQLNGEDTDNGKLIINNLGSSFSHILFKNGNTILGDLYLNGTSLVLGNRRGNNPIGNENINIGHDNWPAGTITGSSNITIGDASMTSLTSGSHNIGLGTTLLAVTTGEHNIGIGDDSLTNITGNGNIAIGGNANPNTANASKTIAIGTNSVAGSIGAIAIGSNIESNESTETDAATARGGFSIAIGNGAISNYDNSINGLSIAIGTNAKANSEDDSGNAAIAIGIGAESNGSAAIAIGSGANATDGRAIAIGDDARATGGRSIAIGPSNGSWDGDNDGSTMAAGENSIALGIGAYSVGTASIAIGNDAHAAESNNIAIGSNAKAPKDDSRYVTADNIAIGNNAMGNSVKAYNSIAIGTEALNNINSSGGMDTAIGWHALTNNTSGYYNTAVGSVALYYNKTGASNTAIGSGACQYVTGSNKTCIGANSGPSAGHVYSRATDNYERIFIGSRSKFNGGAAVLEVHNLDTKRSGGAYDKWYSNQGCDLGSCSRLNDTTVFINGNLVVRGTTFITSKHYGGDSFVIKALEHSGGQMEPAPHGDKWGDTAEGWIPSLHSSDRRLKYVGKESASGLNKIRQLKVFNYTFKKDTTKTPHVGVIAQDLQKVFPNAVKKGKDGFLTIRMEDMFYAVINAIKELDAKYQAQEKRINELEKRIEKLEAKSK